jgi:hypothetical protein
MSGAWLSVVMVYYVYAHILSEIAEADNSPATADDKRNIIKANQRIWKEKMKFSAKNPAAFPCFFYLEKILKVF